jgi:membrane protease YdiL (CAAX protease family)
MFSSLVSRIKAHDVVAYFVLAYLISWGLWIPILVSLPSNPANQTFLQSVPPVVILLVFLGQWSPAISAVVILAITRGKPGLKELLRRLLRWRVPVGWWLVVLLGWAALNLLPALVYAQLKGQPLSLNLSAWSMILTLPLGSAVLLAYYANEELGWRGFALPRLQEKHTALFSSVVIGIGWGCWHLPMFLWYVKGISPSMPFYNFLIEITSVSILMTWIFNHTRGSVLVAMVFHLWHNFYPNYQNALLSNTDPNGLLEFRTWLIAAAAILVVVAYGYRSLARDRSQSKPVALGASEA